MHEELENNQLRTPQVTDESLEEAVAKGINKAKQRAQVRTNSRKRWGTYTALVCSIVLVFALTIKVSPALAAIAKEIPGLRYFVQFIEGDRNLIDAIDEEFVQPVGVSLEKDGLKLTVDGIIADDRRMVVMYSVTNTISKISPKNGGVKVKDAKGTDLAVMFSYDAGGLDWMAKRKEPGVYHDIIDIQLNAEVPPFDEIIVSGEWYVPENTGSEHRVKLEAAVPIDRSRFAGLTQVIEIGQTIDFQGQKATFERATVSPLNIEIEVTQDPANNKEIIGFTDLSLVDENGTELKVKGSYGNVLLFQSNYFSRPKRLMLKGGTVFIFDKDKEKRKVVIDTERMQVLQAPDGRLKMESLTNQGDYDELIVSLNDLDEKESHWIAYRLLQFDFWDAAGALHKMVDPKGSYTAVHMVSGEPKINFHYFLPHGLAAQPLTFTIGGYPNYMKQSFQIDIR